MTLVSSSHGLLLVLWPSRLPLLNPFWTTYMPMCCETEHLNFLELCLLCTRAMTFALCSPQTAAPFAKGICSDR